MKRFQWVLLFGIVVVAISLRPAVASVSPVLETIRADLGLSYTALSLLTTIPILCMGAFALTVPAITDRVGRERGVFWGIVLITVATGIRLGSRHVLVLFGSTLLVGIGIAVTQSLLPSLVTEYLPGRESFATGVYTASLTVGAALAGGVTAPIGDLVGSWPAALAVWAVLAAIGVPLWYLSWRWAVRRKPASDDGGDRVRLPWRNRWAIVLTLFFGSSSTMFFVVLAWLAPRYVALGWGASHAGMLLSAFVVAQLGGNLAVSAVGDRLSDQRPLFALMLFSVIGGATGVVIAPQFVPWIWAVLLGIGTGGLFTLGLTLPVIYAAGPTATDGLASMILGGGYFIAAIGPAAAGVLLDVTGGYTAAFGGLAFLSVVLLAVSMRFEPGRETVTVQVSERSGRDRV
ncbi:MFS transporter [Natrarchaeobius chitinivorans]|nr:MFS transporter [Natrarchaeobius chitinivorans]